MVGNPTEFVHAQRAWGKSYMWPWQLPFGEGNGPVFTFVIAFYLCVMVFFWRRMPLSYYVMILLNLALPLSAGSLVSMPRYISVIFVFPFLLACFDIKRKWLEYGMALLLIGLNLWVFYYWLLADPLTC